MDAINLVVARARIAGGLLLEREAPSHIQVAAGQEILVKVPFRFDEIGDAREDYHVVLRTRLDNEPPQEERVDGKDRHGRSDARRGTLLQRLCILAAGKHTLTFEVHVEVERTAWQGGETVVDSSSLEDEIRIDVR